MFARNRFAILLAEFLGTGILAMVMLSVQHSTIGLPYFVALAAGLALAVAIVMLGREGGGHFNPAITIGMATARQIKLLPAAGYLVAQFLGAWAAYYLYTYFVKTSLQPIGGHYDGRVLVAEAIGALILSLGYASAVFNRYWHTKFAGVAGAAYMIAIVVSSAAAVGIVNPAVALSMRAFNPTGSMGWATYVAGPILGSVIGFNLYALLFAPESGLVKMRAAVSGRLSNSEESSAAVSKPAVSAKSERVVESKVVEKPVKNSSVRTSKKRKPSKK